MKTFAIGLLGCLAAGALLAEPARADIIFNNFGPGDSYNHFSGQSVGGFFHQDVGDRFAPAGSSYTLDQLTLALSVGGPYGVDVLFMTSVNGLPSSVIESWHVPPTPPFVGSLPLTVLDSLLHPLLQENVPYYVVASVPLDQSSSGVWFNNSVGDHGPLAIRQRGGSWFVINDALGRGTMRVEGEPVPEPSTLALVTVGGLVLVGWRRWR